MAVFWVTESCSLVEICRRFRVAFCLHQSIYPSINLTKLFIFLYKSVSNRVRHDVLTINHVRPLTSRRLTSCGHVRSPDPCQLSLLQRCMPLLYLKERSALCFTSATQDAGVRRACYKAPGCVQESCLTARSSSERKGINAPRRPNCHTLQPGTPLFLHKCY
jgi:hypothetical protein